MVGGRFGWARPRKSEPVPKPASPQPASSAREKSTHFGLSEPRTDSSAWLRRQWPHDCDADARSEFVLRRTPPKVTCSFALARWRLSAVVESSEAVVPEKRHREESKGEAEIPPLTPPAVEFAFAFDVAIKGRCRKKKGVTHCSERGRLSKRSSSSRSPYTAASVCPYDAEKSARGFAWENYPL